MYQLTLERQHLLKKTLNTRKREALSLAAARRAEGIALPSGCSRYHCGVQPSPRYKLQRCMRGEQRRASEEPPSSHGTARHSTAWQLGALVPKHGWLAGPEHIPQGSAFAQHPHRQRPTPPGAGAAHLPAFHPRWFTPGNKPPCSLGERVRAEPAMENSHFTAGRRRTEASWGEEGVRRGYLWRCRTKHIEKSKPRPEETLTKIISKVLLRGNQRLNCLLMLVNILINRSNLF